MGIDYIHSAEWPDRDLQAMHRRFPDKTDLPDCLVVDYPDLIWFQALMIIFAKKYVLFINCLSQILILHN
jgi:hypothetical protein